MRIILGSKSPRRQQLLRELGFQFEVKTQDSPESFPSALAPEAVPEFLARQKAAALMPQLSEQDLLITCDTDVILEGEILGKPPNAQAAKQILQALSGKKHQVVSGVCLSESQQQISFSETSWVFFKPLSEASIDYYIRTTQPFDKAGAYGIQDWIGRIGIQKIEGCFYNVMGFPTAHFYQIMQIHYPDLLPERS